MNAGFHDSPLRTNDAPEATGIPAGGAEGPVTLTSMSILLNRYLQKIDTMDKDLKTTKKTLGEAIVKLVKKVKKLEDKLKSRKRKGVMVDSDEETAESKDEIDLDGIHLLDTTTLESTDVDTTVDMDV